MSVLFVCQGNTCRSAVAERLAEDWAREALGIDPIEAGIRIGSAGLGARDGEPMHPMSAEALQELGGHTGAFRSRRFSPALADVGLVLTMTARQRRSVLEVMPLGLRRTFTLTEAGALLPVVDMVDLASMTPGDDRAAELGRRLHEARARRPAPSWSDVDDPIGRRPSAHREAAQKIAAAVRPLVEVLFTPSSPRVDAPPPLRNRRA